MIRKMAQSDGLADAAEMNDAGERGGHGERRDSTSEPARVIILVLIAAQSSVERYRLLSAQHRWP